MEKLVGPRVRAIGVSNFTVANLKKLMKSATIPPAAVQVNFYKLPNNWIKIYFYCCIY